MRTELEIKAFIAHLEKTKADIAESDEDESTIVAIHDSLDNDIIILKWVLGELDL